MEFYRDEKKRLDKFKKEQREVIEAVIEDGLRQIPNLTKVQEAIEKGVCSLDGGVLDPNTHFT